MSFRRRRSRVGPGFQAIIPEMLAIEQKEELQKVYEYEQSLFDHRLTLSSHSNHISDTDDTHSVAMNNNIPNKEQPQYLVNNPHIDPTLYILPIVPKNYECILCRMKGHHWIMKCTLNESRILDQKCCMCIDYGTIKSMIKCKNCGLVYHKHCCVSSRHYKCSGNNYMHWSGLYCTKLNGGVFGCGAVLFDTTKYFKYNYKDTSAVYRNEMIVCGYIRKELKYLKDLYIPSSIYQLLMNWYGDANMRYLASRIGKNCIRYVRCHRRKESLEEKLLLELYNKISCRHLLVKHKDSRRPKSWKSESIIRSKQDATELILRFREEILRGNDIEQSFIELARKESDCNSYKRGGDLGSFGRGRMQWKFEQGAFALDVNELSDVVHTDSGAHLIFRYA